MLPNIDRDLYARFKREGYRIPRLREQPVQTTDDIVRLAYLDVCRTMGGINEQQRDAFQEPVRLFIEKLLKRQPETQQIFDEWHRLCCQNCMSASGNARIHFGQARKLLNISLKYLYNEFAFEHGTVNRFGFPENNVEWFFHLPINGQIRKSLVNNCGFVDPTPLPWSKWSYDDYWKFQSELRSRIGTGYKPLEIDYMLWNTNGGTVDNAIKPF